MQITFFTRKFRNEQRNLHCDIVHITTKWVFRLTLDGDGVYAIKAYEYQSSVILAVLAQFYFGVLAVLGHISIDPPHPPGRVWCTCS